MISYINKEPTATVPNPAKSNKIPPIIIKMAITVTPVGRFLFPNPQCNQKKLIYIYISMYILYKIYIRYLSESVFDLI
jgi:hypothetical protein